MQATWRSANRDPLLSYFLLFFLPWKYCMAQISSSCDLVGVFLLHEVGALNYASVIGCRRCMHGMKTRCRSQERQQQQQEQLSPRGRLQQISRAPPSGSAAQPPRSQPKPGRRQLEQGHAPGLALR